MRKFLQWDADHPPHQQGTAITHHDTVALPVQPTALDTPRAAIRLVHVVIPAHDERERIGACLESVAAATRALRWHLDLRVHTTLVADRCTDGTAAIARELGVEVLEVDAGCVGAARATGVRRVVHRLDDALGPAAHVLPQSALVVNTDADCVVPVSWLVDHVALARDHDLVLGSVQPDPAEMTEAASAVWWARNPIDMGSLHGANLSFRLDAYLRAGGFPEVADQEDLLLVRSMRADGAAVVSGTRVQTSARRDGRVPEGFAGYLRRLDHELGSAEVLSSSVAEPVRPSRPRSPRPRSSGPASS